MQVASKKTFLHKVSHALRLDELPPTLRKTIIGVSGGLVLTAGFAMVFLPGPAFVVIPLGLAILASEFAWARRYLLKGRDLYDKARKKRWRKRTRTVDRIAP